jgi:hypothetical protein
MGWEAAGAGMIVQVAVYKGDEETRHDGTIFLLTYRRKPSIINSFRWF